MKKIVILLFLSVTTLFPAQLSNVEKILQDSDFHYNRNEYSLAIPLYNEYLNINDRDFEVYDRLAICYFRTGDYENAKKNFLRAALVCPASEKEKLATYYSNLSGTYSTLREDEKAYEYATKAYNLDSNSQTLFNAASMANNLDRPAEGLQLLDKSTVEKDNSYNALYGMFHYRLGNYATSAKYYEQFFSNFSREDNQIAYDMKNEKLNLLKDYLYLAADEKLALNDQQIQKIKEIYINIYTIEDGKEELFEMFQDETHLWNKKKKSVTVINQLIAATPGKVPTAEKLMMLYAQNDLADLYKIADQYLKENDVKDQQELYKVKMLRYIGYLNLIIREQPHPPLQIDEQEIKKLKYLFNDMYEKKDYADEETTDLLIKPLHVTFDRFRKVYKTKEEKRKIAPAVLQIVGDFPNKKLRDSVTEILKAGYLEN